MKIYFDDIEINGDYYAGLSKSCTPYDNNFKIGNTICKTYKLVVDNNGYSSIPNVVKIEENGVLKDTLYVYDFKEDDFTTEFTLIDGMIKILNNYDASALMENGTTTLLAIFNDICSKSNIETDIDNFDFANLEVSWYDNRISGRQYLGYIAELNGWNFMLDANGKLIYKEVNTEPLETINFQDIADYKIGNKHKITRVLWDDSNNYWEAGTTGGDTYYIDTNNVYCINQEMVNNIFNKLNGLEFYDFKTTNCPSEAFKDGDLIQFTDGDNYYNVFSQYSNINYCGNWNGGIDINLNTSEQQETQIIGIEEKIKSIKTIVDRNNNTLTTIVEQTTNNTNDLSNLKESVQTQINENKFEITALQNKFQDGVESLKNSTITIDVNGIQVSTTTSAIETLITNDTFAIKSGNTYLAYFGYDAEKETTKSEVDNLKVNNYFVVGHHRIEKFEPDGEYRTGVFYIGG